jgi:hypothetical protein
MTNGDEELQSMATMAAALERLDEAARVRALRWANSRYGHPKGVDLDAREMSTEPDIGIEADPSTSPFDSFAELFDAANPKTEKDKALVAAYWMQICQNVSSFPSQSLNNQLKDLGHGIGNITEALTQLKHDRPALVLQLKKSGTSRQARKTYKLTQEGAKRVQLMIQAEPPAESRG